MIAGAVSPQSSQIRVFLTRACANTKNYTFFRGYLYCIYKVWWRWSDHEMHPSRSLKKRRQTGSIIVCEYRRRWKARISVNR